MTPSKRLVVGSATSPGEPPTWIARSELSLFAVASPVGGSPFPAVFSLDALAASFSDPWPAHATLERPECAQLRAALRATDAQWQERILNDPKVRGPGASLAAIRLRGDRIAVAHLGICRVHQLRDGRILRSTTDHSWRDDSNRRLISRGIGLKSNPEVVSWDLHDEDIFLLTSGVHEVLSEAEFLENMSEDLEPNLSATQILELALARNANGYLTVLIVRPVQRDAS